MTPEMEDRYQTLADFMAWCDPDGYAEALAGVTSASSEPAERGEREG